MSSSILIIFSISLIKAGLDILNLLSTKKKPLPCVPQGWLFFVLLPTEDREDQPAGGDEQSDLLFTSPLIPSPRRWGKSNISEVICFIEKHDKAFSL